MNSTCLETFYDAFFLSSSHSPTLKTYKLGSTIFLPGEAATRVYFLHRGVVKLSTIERTGREITLALLRPNSPFGILPLLQEENIDCFYHAVAFTPVEIFSVPIAQVQQVLEEVPELSVLMTRELARRLLQLEEMIEISLHRSLKKRLVRFFLLLCRDFGIATDRGTKIELKLTHQQLAGAIGTNRVSITYLLKFFKQNELISIYNRQITVRDPVALEQHFAECQELD